MSCSFVGYHLVSKYVQLCNKSVFQLCVWDWLTAHQATNLPFRQHSTLCLCQWLLNCSLQGCVASHSSTLKNVFKESMLTCTAYRVISKKWQRLKMILFAPVHLNYTQTRPKTRAWLKAFDSSITHVSRDKWKYGWFVYFTKLSHLLIMC